MDAGRGSGPERIACLSSELAEILVRLGAGDRTLDLSEARREPSGEGAREGRTGSAEGRPEEAEGPGPDLVLSSGESISGAAREWIRRGVPHRIFRPGSLEEVFRMIHDLGEIAGVGERGRALASELETGLEEIRARGEMLLRHPRVFFEQCPEPLTTGSPWIGELVEAAGGEDLFPEFRGKEGGEGRIVDPAEVLRREPEVIIAAWRGRRVDFPSFGSRPGWERVPAVRRGKLFEIESTLILRPGPTALGRGLEELHRIIAEASLG